MAYKYEEDQPTKDEEKKLNLGGKELHRGSWTLFKKVRAKKRAFLGGDHLSFGEAFKNIRKKYGPNATFIWHGKEYTTKHKK